MDGRRFDELVTALAVGSAPRRLVRGLAGGALAGLLHRLGIEEAVAACKAVGRRCRRDGDCCSRRCRRDACRCARNGAACPSTCASDPNQLCPDCCGQGCFTGTCCTFPGNPCPAGCPPGSTCAGWCSGTCGAGACL